MDSKNTSRTHSVPKVYVAVLESRTEIEEIMPPPKDPEKYKLWKERVIRAAQNRDPLCYNKMAETQKKRLADPIVRERMGVASRIALADPEVKRKMREVQLGKKDSDETKRRKRDSHIGKILPAFTDIHKENLSSGAKKRFENPEERQRVSDSAKLRPPVAKETKRKMADSQKHAHELDPELTMRKIEGRIGGFWYGNVKYWYADAPQYCEKFNAEFKERVRAFWGYTCFQCGTPQNGKKLGVHHIHYDKKMCCNGSPQDCIPLCEKCHPKTNYNRDYWEDYFTELLYAYCPDGKCFFTKEEMKKFTSSIA